MNRYTFRRYRDGELKAEGAVVRANTLAEALEKARSLSSDCNCEAVKWARDRFDLASVECIADTTKTPQS